MKRPTLFVALVTAALFAPDVEAAPTWLTPTTLTAADTDVVDAGLAVSPKGDVLVTWPASGGAQFRLRQAGGDFAPVLENTNAGSPDFAFDFAGNAVAVWTQSTGSPPLQIVASFRPFGGSFGPPVQISNATVGQAVGLPHVALAGNGDAVAVWEFYDGTINRIQAAIRPAGGSFGDAQTISAAGQGAGNVDVAADPEGNAVAVWPRSDGANDRIEAGFRPAGGSFSMGTPISAALQNASSPPHAAFDQNGNAIAVWARSDGSKRRAQASFRPKGGSFQPADTLSDAGHDADLTQVAFDGQGNALVYWMRQFWTEVAFRPAGGSFEAPKRISPIDHNGWYPSAAFTANGDAHVIWVDQDATTTQLVEAVRPAGGSFTDFHPLSPNGAYVYVHSIGADAEGNAAIAWLQTENGKKRVQVAGFDGAPPRLSDLSFPANGLAGNALNFGATAFDVWSPVSLAWDFGDGSMGDGTAPTHAYAGPGAFGARVTATDAVGNASSASGNVAVDAPPPIIATRDLLAPVMSALKLTPARFAAAPRRSSRAAKTGTTITFKLSEAGRVTFRVQRAGPGRRVGRACRKPTVKNRKRTRCTRYVTLAGSFSQKGLSGANKRAFNGRLRGRPLAPGAYRLVATAVDAAGNRGKQVRAAFKVLRARR